MHWSKTAFILALAPLLAPAVEFESVTHDKTTGKTTVKWSNVDTQNGVVVFRNDRSITGDEHFFAEKHIFPAGATQGVISADGSGKFFYRLAELTPFRRISGKLSAEKSIEEFDRSTPATAEYTFERKQYDVIFKLTRPAAENAAKLLVLTCQTAGSAVKTIAEAPAAAGEIAVAVDKLQNFAALAVADRFGKYAMPETWYFCGNQPDISINTSPLIAKNKDVALSDRIMTVGEKSTVSFTFRNNGGASGKVTAVVTATENSGSSQELLRQDAGEVAPGGKKVISVDYTPQKAGKIIFALELQTANDVDKTNNRLTLELYATQQKIYFLWYGGNVMELEYANYASVHADDLAEFTRRGGKNLATTSRTENKSGEAYYNRVKSSRAVGMQLDEIGGNLKATRFLPAIVDFEKRHPELLSAVWHIGNSPQKEVIEALKKRQIDLIMPEIYFTDGTAKERAKALKSLRGRLEKLRKTGVAEYMLIGLGTHRNYLGWGGSPAKHAEFIEEQIKLVREILPMTPGIAFYSSDADAELLKKVDQMCKKYFLENER
ncbi:MAG: hypothetical protein IKA65_06030 [Lentisphaeria bacterium]|nr:hypothetical protein [Lentisphaeria bacterium]